MTQRCGNCKWWKPVGECAYADHVLATNCTGECAYPLPICIPDRIQPYYQSGKDCPTWHAKD